MDPAPFSRGRLLKPLKGMRCFLKVRRVGAPVAGGRKALVFHGFAIPLENMKANDAFWAFARLSLLLFHVHKFLHTLKYSGLRIVDRHAFLVGLPLHGFGHARLRSNAHPLERLREFF